MSRGSSKRSRQGWKPEWANQQAAWDDPDFEAWGAARPPSPVASASSNHSVRNTRPRYHSPAPAAAAAAAAAAAPAAAHAMPSSESSVRPASKKARGAASAPSRVQRPHSPHYFEAARRGKELRKKMWQKQMRLKRANERTYPKFETDSDATTQPGPAAAAGPGSRHSSGRAPSVPDDDRRDVRSEAVGRAGRDMRALRKKPARRPGARPVNERDYRKFNKRGSPSQFKRRHGER